MKMIKCCKIGLFLLAAMSTLVMATTAMAEETKDNFFAMRLGLGGLNDPVSGTGILDTSIGLDYYTGLYSAGIEYSVGIGGGSTLSNVNINAGYYVPIVPRSMFGYGRLGYGSTSGGGGISGGGFVYEIGIEFDAGSIIFDVGYKNFSVNLGTVAANAGGFFIGMDFPLL